ncbi:hypothetical protein [Luteitalea sp. TBR-22]|uniref:hypothetical protein n=1 Tax=Luteitalea sp. TBR-22 TaxID=2802971 RepID=UPI001EF6BF9B|nr:hypothetical protein [Luteitalea sp. TBR-22]
MQQQLPPKLSSRDLVLRQTGQGWRVEDATGRQVCETLSSMAEARLIGRTFAVGRARVWVYRQERWSLLDGD